MAEMPETVSQLNSLEESLADYQRGIDTGKNPDSRAYLERAAELARAAALLAYPVADTGGGRGPPEGGRFPERVGPEPGVGAGPAVPARASGAE